jgi:hypothetical protein
VEAAPAEWLRMAAGVEPPSYVLPASDPLVADLHGQVARLAAENEALRSARDEAIAAQLAVEARAGQLEAENAALRERVSELEALLEALQPPSLDDFLAARGRGELPADLPQEEVDRLRELVLATKANRPEMLAIAAGLGAVYRTPLGHQRLTTLSFKDHPYDSLWRARVGKYRIVYGLLNNRVHPIVVGSRGEVYELAVHALRHKQL